MKTCTTCKAEKPLTEFGKKGRYLQPSCRPCRAVSGAAYRNANGGQVRARNAERMAAWRAANPDKAKSLDASNRARRADKRRVEAASYRAMHRGKLNDLAKKRTTAMPDAYIAHLLASGRGALTRDHIPQVLIDAKREHLKLLRLIKDMTA